MSGTVKLGVMIILAVVVVGLVVKLLAGLLSLLVPLAIIAGVGLILYGLISRKSLGGGRRYLP